MNREKWRAFLELGRVSNLPTTVSNVTAGYIFGGGNLWQMPKAWIQILIAVICFYEGGMVLNDVCDFKTDSTERPKRPIPSGRTSLSEAIFLSVGLLALGLIVVWTCLPAAMGLAVTLVTLITLYNFTHGFFAYSPVLIGCCRGVIYLLAAMAGGWSFSRPTGSKAFLVPEMAGALTVYVSAVSFLARDELKENVSRFRLKILVGILLVVILLGLSGIYIGCIGSLYILAFLFFFTWVLLTGIQLIKKRILPTSAVGRLLAGICLFDALLLAKIGTFFDVSIAWTCFIGARKWQRRIPST